jgi:hypothetical protein
MDERRNPIHSTFEDDTELEDDIDRFVIHLAERVDVLQDAEIGEHLNELNALAEAMAADCERTGYPTLAAVARQICEACKEEKIEAIEEYVVELTELARRVRLGHRGAAG